MNTIALFRVTLAPRAGVGTPVAPAIITGTHITKHMKYRKYLQTRLNKHHVSTAALSSGNNATYLNHARRIVWGKSHQQSVGVSPHRRATGSGRSLAIVVFIHFRVSIGSS